MRKGSVVERPILFIAPILIVCTAACFGQAVDYRKAIRDFETVFDHQWTTMNEDDFGSYVKRMTHEDIERTMAQISALVEYEGSNERFCTQRYKYGKPTHLHAAPIWYFETFWQRAREEVPFSLFVVAKAPCVVEVEIVDSFDTTLVWEDHTTWVESYGVRVFRAKVLHVFKSPSLAEGQLIEFLYPTAWTSNVIGPGFPPSFDVNEHCILFLDVVGFKDTPRSEFDYGLTHQPYRLITSFDANYGRLVIRGDSAVDAGGKMVGSSVGGVKSLRSTLTDEIEHLRSLTK